MSPPALRLVQTPPDLPDTHTEAVPAGGRAPRDAALPRGPTIEALPDREGAASPGQRNAASPRGLGQILLDRGALGPGDLLRAVAIQQREQTSLEEILRHHDLVREADLAAGLAELYGTAVLGPAEPLPDTRLIDALGAEACLRLGVLPWRHIGGAVLVACTRPDGFAALRPEIEARLGPVVMAVISPTELQSRLLALRAHDIDRTAQTRIAQELSCRSWQSGRFRLQAMAVAVAAIALAVTYPQVLLIGLLVWVLLTQATATALKAAAFVAHLLHQRREARAEAAGRRATAATGSAPLHRAPRLPVVTMLVPLFREADIAPRLIQRLSVLSYPRELLDVLLVVEERDHITRAALRRTNLPRWMRVITVPHGPLCTKPRALNYAMNFARGSIVGVWDAEDAPAPDQIHRVARRFGERGPDLACVQGVLDYYNPRTNWLSRCFTIEYAAWFRIVLPGMERLGLAVPLGGTTLFFRREALERLGGWDAYNVTEDADLGIRLARMGYRTELLPTVTQEEANCRVLPWIRQRSRWLKGYAMTWAVHMRNPVRLWRELGAWRFFGVQVLFLGTLSQFALAPLLWSFWLYFLGFGHPLAEALPLWCFVAMAVLFLVSEVVNLSVMLVAVSGRRHRFLRIWVPLMHAYFPLAALATYKGLWELATRPFYWDKTAHGLFDEKPRSRTGPRPVGALAA